MKRWRWIAEFVLPPVALVCLVVLAWEAVVRGLELKPYLLPGPVQVAQAAANNADRLAMATRRAGAAALAGFGLSLAVGTLTAFVFSQSRLVRRGAYPLAVFLQTVPIVAIAPLIIVWFGYGFRSVVIISFVLGLFPIIAGATTGLTNVDRQLLQLFALHNAGRWQTLWKLRLPHALPYLVGAAKVSCGLCVIGAIVGEYFVGYGTTEVGLGLLVIVANAKLDTPLLFAAVIASTLLSVVFFAGVTVAGHLILRRWHAPARS